MSSPSEDAVKQKLGIESWRNLSKDGVLRLVAMMPDLSKDVALKIAEQFPDFKLLATETLNAIGEHLKAALDSNHKSQKRVYRAYQKAQDAYIRELDRDLTVEERRAIYDRILDVADRVDKKDDKGKDFILRALSLVGASLGVVILAALAVLGGKAALEQGDKSS